jgi:predicted DNA-binding transcriptional regulator AlpA
VIETAYTETDLESETEKKRRRLRVHDEITPTRPLPALLLKREEAAACLGMSPESFDEHVRPTLRQVPVSPGLVLFRPRDIEEWLDCRAQDPPRD